MKLQKPKFEEIRLDNPLAQIERCARVCYKSEDKIAEGTALRMINMLASKDHSAMLEHGTIYLKCHTDWKVIYPDGNEVHTYSHYSFDKIAKSPYSRSYTDSNSNICYITTNLRVIFENSRELYDTIIEHKGEPYTDEKRGYSVCRYTDSKYFLLRPTIIFDMDRINSQSFCRHRVMSFAQESTRWCNYIKDKFGHEITISVPCWMKEEDWDEFISDMEVYEQTYFKWIEKGYRAEEARIFLPFGLNTEIVMTGFIDGWQHFFQLRNDPYAHPSAQELAAPLEEYFNERNYR